MAEIEKVLMTERSGGGNDAATMAALWGQQNQWNNPLMYLVFLEIFKQRNNCEGVNGYQQLSNQMQDNQNSNLLMDAIRGNGNALSSLASNLNCDFNTLNSAVCSVQSAIDKVAGQVGYSAEKVINAANMGDCRIIEAINNCCCNTQQSILKMGYENQLANERQTNTLLSRIDTLNSIMQSGFASVGYETQKQTCDILNNNNANSQRIIDTLNNHWRQELESKYQDVKAELVQVRTVNDLSQQIAALAAKLPTTTSTTTT